MITNHIQLIGRLTKDAELFATKNGKIHTNFTLAVDRKTSEKEADFFPATLWGEKIGNALQPHLTKGRLVSVAGEMKIDSEKKKIGNEERYLYYPSVVASDVILLDSNKKSEEKKQTEEQSITKTAQGVTA